MNRFTITLPAVLIAGTLFVCDAAAVGRGGGGGRMGGGGMGGGMYGGGRPAMSAPHYGGGRPQMNMPAMNRPQMSRPQMPQAQISRPQMNYPSGGMSQAGRPSMSRPQLPTTRPGSGLKPVTTRPGAGMATPYPGRPSGPGAGATRPGGSSSLPHLGGARPGDARPGARPSPAPSTRPNPGAVDDFLGISRPGGATRPAPLPGQIGGNRPGRPGGDRPGGATRPTPLPGQIGGNRPGGNRPGNRPEWIGGGNRPWNPGGNNGHIHRPPSWSNRPGAGNVHDNWYNIVNRPGHPGMNQWLDRHPSRYAYWNYWGSNVRQHWGHYHDHNSWFRADWWNRYPHHLGGWHYMYWNRSRGWNYWWTVPTYMNVVTWFNWSAPQAVWSQPIYYDYGSGGNVYYEDNSVYVNGQQIGTAEDFAASAATLATVEPPATQEEAESAEWMPLGTFAVSSNESETDPSRIVQLAVNRQGIVSGSFYNTATDEAQAVLGQVDKDTQRVALRIGESDDVILETGLYNLTKDEAPAMVHFGPDRVEYWLLVRLKSDEEAPGSGR
ncbi:MAG: mu-protocadherin- cell-suface protein [Pirellulales bacterium]|nr:mu-protocadherin- cell-suface protein [Pirellulales bacterium]